MFKKLFGGGESSKPMAAPSASTTQKTIDTIEKLSENEEQISKRKDLLEKRINAEVQKAREFTRAKKQAQALMCLKRKKLLENEITNLDNMSMRIIEQRLMIESQNTTVAVMSAMHATALTAKDNMKAMQIENVDKVMDEITEVNDQMRQIQDLMGQPTGMAAELDDDELAAELEELEAMQLDEELMEPAPVPTKRVPAAAQEAPMPSAPTTSVKAKTEEELELEALERELA